METFVDKEAHLLVHPVRHIQPVQHARLSTQMIGTVAAVPVWRLRRKLPVVCQSDNADENPVTVVETHVYERAYQSMSGEGSTDDSQLSELEETHTRNVVDVPRQPHPTVDDDYQILDTVIGLEVDVRHPHSGTAAVMQTMAEAQPYQLRLRTVERKSVGTRPRLDTLDERRHPRS